MLRDTKRYLVYGGLFVMMLISYVDRINLSVAAGPISRAYGLDTIAMGYLLSAYLWTYLIFLIPVGAAVDRWGARQVTAGSLAVWSGGGVLTGLATGFGTMVGSRLVLGAGEAASYPAGGRAIREWAPRSERGLAAAWLNGGAYAGPAIGALAVGWIVTEFGWRAALFLTRLYNRLLRPGLAAAIPALRAIPTPLKRAFDAVSAQIDQSIKQAQFAP